MKFSKLFFLLMLMVVSISTRGSAQVANQKQADIDSGFEWYSMEEAQQLAAMNDKKVLLFGYAEWCGYCRKMRKETFPDSSVIASIEEHYYPVQMDGQSQQEVVFNGQKLKAYELASLIQLGSYPTHYFIGADGKIIGAQPGFIESDVYTLLLKYVGTDSFGKMKFEEFLEQEK